MSRYITIANADIRATIQALGGADEQDENDGDYTSIEASYVIIKKYGALHTGIATVIRIGLRNMRTVILRWSKPPANDDQEASALSIYAGLVLASIIGLPPDIIVTDDREFSDMLHLMAIDKKSRSSIERAAASGTHEKQYLAELIAYSYEILRDNKSDIGYIDARCSRANGAAWDAAELSAKLSKFKNLEDCSNITLEWEDADNTFDRVKIEKEFNKFADEIVNPIHAREET